MESVRITLGDTRFELRLHTDREAHMTGRTADRHCHAEYEVHIILAGACTMDVSDTSVRLSAGEALLIPPGQYHRTTDASAEYSRFILPFIPKAPRPRMLVSASPFAHIRLPASAPALCRSVQAELEESRPFRSEALRAQYTLLLTALLRSLLSAAPAEKTAAPAVTDARLALIDDYFEQHLHGDATADEMARQLSLSHRQLSRVLMAYYGMTFREKIRHARMDRAGWLLRTTALSVSEISQAVGYDSETSFFKAFKAHYGITPLAYRKEKRGNEP